MGSEPGTGLAVVAVAESLAAVDRALADGADLVELADAELTRRVRERHPDLAITVERERVDADRRLAEAAAATGAALITQDPGQAAATGAGPDAVLVDVVIDPAPGPGAGDAARPEPVRRLRELLAAGWPVLVTLPDAGDTDADLAGALAAAVVCAQHGARYFRTHHVLETRQALDMLATIRGDRPPAAVRRGLA